MLIGSVLMSLHMIVKNISYWLYTLLAWFLNGIVCLAALRPLGKGTATYLVRD